MWFLLLISASTPFIVSYFCKRFSFVDRPDGNLKNHPLAVPYIGGVSVLIITVLLFPLYQQSSLLFLLLIQGLLGIADDKFSLSPFFRIFVQVSSFFFYIYSQYDLPPFYCFIFAFFCSAFINALNFIDIKDGLFLSFSIPLLLLLISISPTSSTIVLLSLILFPALLSLYFLNREPAAGYMGDGGVYILSSLVLTFMFELFFSSDFLTFISSAFVVPLTEPLSSSLAPQLFKYTSVALALSPVILSSSLLLGLVLTLALIYLWAVHIILRYF